LYLVGYFHSCSYKSCTWTSKQRNESYNCAICDADVFISWQPHRMMHTAYIYTTQCTDVKTCGPVAPLYVNTTPYTYLNPLPVTIRMAAFSIFIGINNHTIQHSVLKIYFMPYLYVICYAIFILYSSAKNTEIHRIFN